MRVPVRKTITLVSRLLQYCAVAAVLPSLACAAQISFDDTAFHNPDWDLVTVSAGSGGFAFSLREQMPGRPETYRGITLVLNPGPSAICVVHFRRGAVVDPSTSGAIGRVSFRMTIRDSFGQMGPSRFGPAIRQNGRIFVAGPCPWFSASTTSWTRVAMSSLRAFDFMELSSRGTLLSRSGRPDFSPHAPPMQLGFAWWAVNSGDQTVLTGGSVHRWSVTVQTAQSMAMRDVKSRPDGEDVALGHGVVSAAFPDMFYLSAADRSSGIRVRLPNHGLTAGTQAGVIGTLKTNEHGERFIEGWVAYPGGLAAVRPLGMRIADLGGGDAGYDPASGRGQRGVVGGRGVNNIGLLVRVAGRVEETSDTGDRFVILNDGSSAVRVLFVEQMNLPPPGAFIVVEGVSSCLAGPEGAPVRALLAVAWEGSATGPEMTASR
ncbi:MAG: hypothetical protein KatS3mg024_1723 [Armatimonadota bacterium]|nr:MAG: hypothetical protein KatS3mg024_1723 [Armatimonadota bacterium]